MFLQQHLLLFIEQARIESLFFSTFFSILKSLTKPAINVNQKNDVMRDQACSIRSRFKHAAR